MQSKNIYLIPCHLSELPKLGVLSAFNEAIIQNVKYLFVEDIRSARRFISSLKLGVDINSITLIELNKDTSRQEIRHFLGSIPSSIADIGILSEAGCPGIADPGSKLIALAHEMNWKVIPIPGPSSIFLGLMASGFNGQNFSFKGYLPIKQDDRIKSIRKIEDEVWGNGSTQIFIETPFRNQSILSDLLNTLKPNTLLCIASNLTSIDEFIATKKASEWKNNIPQIHKIPTIFLIGRYDTE